MLRKIPKQWQALAAEYKTCDLFQAVFNKQDLPQASARCQVF